MPTGPHLPQTMAHKKITHHPLFFFFTLLILLMLPVGYAHVWQKSDWTLMGHLTLASTALLVIVLLAGRIGSRILPKTGAAMVALILIILLVLRFFHALLLDFSGQGFTSEVFIHAEKEALRIGAHDYAVALLGLAAVIVMVFVWIYRHPFWHPETLAHARANELKKIPGWLGLVIASTAAVTLLWGYGRTLPVSQLVRAYDDFTSPPPSTAIFNANTADEAIEKARKWLVPIRGNRPLPTQKKSLQASASPDSPNLILVYLESFNQMFTENPRYPGLTPHIDALKKRFTVLENNYSSGYVTIEGIANSQCGTLMNMQFANNSLTTPNGRLPKMACLGDILHKAGYRQTFLGGARAEFSGKGEFFTDHGYDTALGWTEWAKQGFENYGWWGLADADLFEQALKIIEDHRQDKHPYNVTLLTLGTHLPGFTYRNCPKYKNDPEDPYLNAIHCTDYLLGRFVEQLEKKGILEDTVLYIQGDHGVFYVPDPSIRLFGRSNVEDQRVLTLVSTPEAYTSDQPPSPVRAPTSTYDTVANILDWLNVSHNAHFLLAERLQNVHADRYLVSRYNDYYKGRKYHAATSDCPPKATKDQPGLPLSYCDKRITMQAIYAINNLYTQPDIPLQQRCDNGLSIIKNGRTSFVQVAWGGRDISRDFSQNGFPVSSTQPGALMLVMDHNGNLINQLHFDLENQNHIRNLKRYLEALQTGQTAVVTRTTKPERIPAEIRAQWPELVKTYTFFVARARTTNDANTQNDLDILLTDTRNRFGYRIFPEICGKPVERNVTIKSTPEVELCPITRWGPQKTQLGQGFNVQADSRSAFWFKTTCTSREVTLYLDGVAVKTVVRPPDLITAALPGEQVINKPGEHILELVNLYTGEPLWQDVFHVVDPAHSPATTNTQKIKPTPPEEKRQLLQKKKGATPSGKDFCAVKKWGPKKITAGKPFNIQGNGDSAFWVFTDCAPDNAVISLDGKPLKTVGGPPQFTALMPASEIPAQAGRYTLALEDPQHRRKLIIGHVTVKKGGYN